jgi:hypothetical protein
VKILGFVLALMLLTPQPPAGGKIESDYDKKADFSKYKTYTWTMRPESYRPKAHDLIVAGIDNQMASLGLSRDDSGKGDLSLTYLTLRTAQVNLKEVEKLEREGNKEQAHLYDMGKLVIVVREASTNRRLWAATTLEHMSQDQAAREQTINQAITRLFQTYPTRKK